MGNMEEKNYALVACISNYVRNKILYNVSFLC